MATRIAEYITQKMLASSVIEEDDRELYNYGFFLLITRIFFFLVTVFVGFLLDIPGESILFYVVFFRLRSYAGGVHARTEMTCTILTTLALTVAIFGIKIMTQVDSGIIPMLMLASGSLCVLLFSPLDTEAKPLDNYEKKRYRMICYAIVLLCIAGAFALHILLLNTFFYSIVCGVSLESLLLIAGKIID